MGYPASVFVLQVALLAGAPLPEPAGPPRSSAPPASVTAASMGRLRGEVSFSRQEAVAGALVVLVRNEDPRTLFAGTTDRDGFFRFESVPAGVWAVGVVRDGAAPQIKDGVAVSPPARSVVDIVLKKDAGRLTPPVFDLGRFARGAATAKDAALMSFTVYDAGMKPVNEARVLVRSRGPKVDPLRGVTDGNGMLRLQTPEPGEYQLRIEMPGYLPIRIDRLVLGREAPIVTAVLTPRPFDFPGSPADLLPEEKPVPPEGFPGSIDKKQPGPAN